ncbi:cryptochrome/photolyase family protein [Parapedobacter koreensis]|uniref:Deoxyribodipyrimidine photo-lyase n=1 Tax=Parapedobacter koreensis TaxID=332977 RepID=A0A1H7EW33_9SPHI|nr:deoxyribodipyrimidine photo-lyase [Parapedobacter koreensis]SEK17824.1 deoxyribodipyrimidine photo-lyase [Parapedobacter koreensis]
MEHTVVIFWFRRDLRLEDNAGLQRALSSGYPVLPIFIFDTDMLNRLNNRYDRRVDYIQQALAHLHLQLQKQHAGLKTYYGKPITLFHEITAHYAINAVYCNRDYEPQAIKRDNEVKAYLAAKGIAFYHIKDQVIFEQSEVIKQNGTPYTVYTPYSNAWKATLQSQHYAPVPTAQHSFEYLPFEEIHTLEAIGFRPTDIRFRPPELDVGIVEAYDRYRDFPAMDHSTHLGMALRFGTISIRRCVAFALQHNAVWLQALIWREFFMQILYHFPHVVSHSFKPAYDLIQWQNNETEFRRWCEGQTGYAMVDAGMHQLNSTGFIPNRVRMITASFLCKHLLIDWRWGEAYFADKLNDYDLAANNGNWQWAAGCGCDAAPYFRIFNPTVQAQKFDKAQHYTKAWIPDVATRTIKPIVEHRYARERALKVYSEGLNRMRSLDRLSCYIDKSSKF